MLHSALETPSSANGILNLVREERAKSLSPREWQHRLAGYGYAVRETARGWIVESVVSGDFVCTMPAEAS